MIDIEKIIDKAIENNLDPAIFSQVDDGDIKQAPNVIEFCIGKDYLNLTPYPRQIQMLLNLFEDACLNPKCTDLKMLSDLHRQPLAQILDRITFFEYGKCPKCKSTRYDFIKTDAYTSPYELDACIGQRAGKSSVTGMGVNYLFHWYCKLASPSNYFNLLPNSTLHFTMTALTFEQASDTLFQPFMDYHSASPWWTQYYEMLDYYGQKMGEELYKVGDTHVWNGVKRLTVYPKGPDKRKMRGRTRFGYAIDEIGWFTGESDSVKMSADEVDHALNRSCTTIRTAAAFKVRDLKEVHVPNAIGFNISSPSHANDKIMRLVRGGRNDPTKRVFHYATWEAHPNISRNSLEPEFRRDPVAAERDFGANPPIADSPFVSNLDSIKGVFRGKPLHSIATFKTRTGTYAGGNSYIYAECKPQVSDKTTPFVLSIDAGHTNNSFAIVLSHIDDNIIYHDLCYEISPIEGHDVNFSHVFESVLKPIFMQFNVALFVADRWNSVKLLQDAEKNHNVKFEQYSLTWNDFVDYRTAIFEERVIAPKTEETIDSLLENNSLPYEQLVDNKPMLHLALQMMTVKESGKKVEKGDGGLTDDIWRACALAGRFLIHEDYKYLRKKGSGRISTRALGTFRTKSGGGNSMGGGGQNRTGSVRTRRGG